MESISADISDFFRILDQVSDPVFLIGTDFKFIWSNRAYCSYIGLNSEKIISMKLENVIPAEYCPVLKKKFLSISKENPEIDNTYPSVLTNGSIIVEKWHNEGIFDSDGKLKYYYCIATLGNSKKEPLNLNVSDLISNTLVKSSILGIIIAVDGKILFTNQKVYNLLCLEACNSLDNHRVDTLLKSIFPAMYKKILGNDKIEEAESLEVMIKTSGGERWLSIIRKYQLHNKRMVLLLLIEDVTARKMNELEIQRAKNNLSDVMRIAKIGSWEKDFKNDCWIWSNEIYNIFGITRGTKITEKLLKRYTDKDSMNKRTERMTSAFSSEEELFSYHIEYRILPQNDEPKWISGESFYRQAENGSPPRFYGWVQDITERKKVEETLKQAKEKAEASELLKTAFLANMSHEIRTPLNAILGFSDLLTKTTSAEEQQKFKKIINQSSRLLLNIINDILDISTIDSGNFELFYEKIRISKLLTELENFYSEHEDENVRLIIQKFDNKSKFSIDRERLKQILINLINNAYKYTKEGTITVSCRINTKADQLVFSVIDTGVGIETGMHHNIFERFYQVDGFSKGTGLGLSISRSLITQMGGEISVKSALGQGSQFTITLPIK
ncbi:MAG: PAS domain S-box protein [Spirochaetales bacterium]|nr:PAS domain S-box protein [Spirochaetales bacterium]